MASSTGCIDETCFYNCHKRIFATQEHVSTAIRAYRHDRLKDELNDIKSIIRTVFKNVRESRKFFLYEVKEWKRLFEINDISIENFVTDLFSILCKSKPKVNCLFLYGESNSGKSLLAYNIVKPFVFCSLTNFKSGSEFVYEPALNSSVVLIDEIAVTKKQAPDFKQILSGGIMTVSKKHSGFQLLTGRPVIATSQYEALGMGWLPGADELAFKNRMIRYKFSKEFRPTCRLSVNSLWLLFSEYESRL